MSRRILSLVIFLVFPAVMHAVEINSVLVPESFHEASAPKALRLAESLTLEPLAKLQAAEAGAADQLHAIAEWNRSHVRPAKNGFARAFAIPKEVRFSTGLLKRQPARFAGGALLAPPSGGLVWGAEVRIEDSYRLRLHLTGVDLPAGTRMWVYGEGGAEEVAFDPDDVLSGHELWTPSVAGPAIRLEVRLPDGALDGHGFTLDKSIEIFELDGAGAPVTRRSNTKVDFSCARDAACYSNSTLSVMDLYKKSVAHLQFVEDGQDFICTGGLMNDTDDSSVIPYLLTAHHCISSQASAASLEAFFDFVDDSCLGSPPSLGSLPRTNGATLLATSAGSDFTFVRLSSLPAGRALMGSTNEGVSNGAVLHRLSHPFGVAMGYSVAAVAASGLACSDAPRPNFIYSSRTLGATFPGSSGSPVIRPDGRIVGQLLGACGPTAQEGEGCDSSNYTVDGALAITWPSIAQWLTPTTSTGTCVPSATVLCLGATSRFKVEATFDTGSQQGQAQAVKLTNDTGYLWFFDATNVELVVKVLDACSFNHRFWIYAGGLTNVRTVLTVTDMKTGTPKAYINPQKTAFQPIQDSNALETCP
ncbi:MAG: serine protease [Thermoanaerobaculia bacterium]